jgi:hypothetical protein
VNSKPKGAIDLATIENIKKSEKTVLVLEFPGRTFELKAKNEEDCTLWIQAIKAALKYAESIKTTRSKTQP